MADAVRQSRWSLPAVVSIAVGLLFAVSLSGKLLSPTATLNVLTDVWHFPAAAATGLFVALCASEAGLGILLLARPGRRMSLLFAAVFTALLTTSPILQLVSGSDGPCGCGLPGSDGGSADLAVGVIRNIAIILAAVLAA